MRQQARDRTQSLIAIVVLLIGVLPVVRGLAGETTEQVTFTGHVIDKEGRPIPGADVRGYGEGQPNRCFTQTDATGNFLLDSICARQINLNVDATYQGKRLSAYVITDGGIGNVQIVAHQGRGPVQYIGGKTYDQILQSADKVIAGVAVDDAVTLAGRPMPGSEGIEIDSMAAAKGRAIVVCFFDYQQRPSRNTVMKLARQTETLKAKGIDIVAIQVSQVDRSTLDSWARKNSFAFPVGTITGNVEVVRAIWSVKSLPWLILADKDRTVRAEGFAINDLETKVREMTDAKR